MISVVIADDQLLVASAFATLVEHAADLQVVGQAADGQEALDVVRRTRPDIVLMDIRMPHLDGIQATKAIIDDAALDRTKVIVLTTFGLDEYVTAAIRAGASAFLLKDTEPADLLAAIRIVHLGEALLSPSVTRQLIEQFVTMAGTPVDQSLVEPLTQREREVVVEVARGRSNDEIAARLTISPLTAKTHVSRSLQKLGLRDRAQLVVAAYEAGLVTPGNPE